MTEHSIEKLIFKSSDGGVFDTPKARHHLTAKWGWLAFYTAAKIVVAITILLFAITDIMGWVFHNDGRFWEDAWAILGSAGVATFVFFILEKNVFWGFRAYLDAAKRNDALEEQIKNGSDAPLYVEIVSTEKSVPATKDRLLSLLFVLSKYLLLLVYGVGVGILFYNFVLLGPISRNELWVWMVSVAVGPLLIGFMAWWVFRSEKEIRKSFAGSATFQDDLESIRARNAELEDQLNGFEGVSKEETLKLEEKIGELNGQVEASDAALSEAHGEADSLRQQLASAQGSTSDVERALAESQQSQGDMEKQLEQEKASRGVVEARLENLASEFGQNCTVQEAFKALDVMVNRQGGLEKLDAGGMSLLAKLMRDIRVTAPDSFDDAKSLSFVSAEEQRINQYDAIVRLYSQKIQKLRASDMDEEEQQDAIDAMRRLRDREIAELEGAS